MDGQVDHLGIQVGVASRAAAAQFRGEAPLSMTQETRLAGGRFAPAHDLGTMYAVGGQVSEGAEAVVLALGLHRPPRPRREREVDTPAGLDAGLLVGAEHVVVLAKRLPFPYPLVEIQDAGGLEGEVRVAGKDPRPVLPGLQGVISEPTAHSGRRGRGSDATGRRMAVQLGAGSAGQGRSARGGHLAGEGLDPGHDAGREHRRPRARRVG